MAILTTGELTVPEQIFDPWVKNVQEGSVIAALSPQKPMKFGKGEAFIFDTDEAEYVGEGAQKGGSEVTSSTQSYEPYKFHKTVRFTEEVLWADEDHQLGVVREILSKIQPALSRALDFGLIHGINPKNGEAVAAMARNLSAATNVVTVNGEDAPYVSLDAADALVVANGGVPSDIALDPAYAAGFVSARNADGVKLYPNLSYTGISELDGHRAAASRTVSAAGVIAAPSNLLAVVGDFSAIQWGIQKSIGLELIKYGDPDGAGDLKRNNQVAFRAEVVYGWGVADLDQFALIKGGDQG